jgi:hypothetical protein
VREIRRAPFLVSLLLGLLGLACTAAHDAPGAAAGRATAGSPAANASASQILSTVPGHPDARRRYLFYLHGRILEEQGRHAESAVFGRYEYDAILTALAARGFVVIAELRPPGTGEEYADNVAAQVKRLLAAGVPPRHVTVAGFSKGGHLTVGVSAAVGAADVTYVVMAGCSADPNWVAHWAPRVRGRMLSLFDSSDRFKPSCAPLFAAAPGLTAHRERVFDSGLDHGLFYRPREEWLSAISEWAPSAAEPSPAPSAQE